MHLERFSDDLLFIQELGRSFRIFRTAFAFRKRKIHLINSNRYGKQPKRRQTTL
jgi:hypothetical protein